MTVNMAGLDEAARRLRALGHWDNKLADLIQIMVKQVEALDEFTAPYLANDLDGVPTDIKTWDDFDKRLALFYRLRWLEAGNACQVPAEALIWIARQSWTWRKMDATPPVVMRKSGFNVLVLEWKKPECFLLIDGAGVSASCDQKKYEAHGLVSRTDAAPAGSLF